MFNVPLKTARRGATFGQMAKDNRPALQTGLPRIDGRGFCVEPMRSSIYGSLLLGLPGVPIA